MYNSGIGCMNLENVYATSIYKTTEKTTEDILLNSNTITFVTKSGCHYPKPFVNLENKIFKVLHATSVYKATEGIHLKHNTRLTDHNFCHNPTVQHAILFMLCCLDQLGNIV
jgi:hypothetical protein